MILETFLALIILFISIPVIVLFIEVAAAFKTAPDKDSIAPDRNVKIAVVVPAHNEEAIIGETINALKSQLTGSDRLLVVADNCSDNTAQKAREQGTEVQVRHNPGKLGKGYALDHGISYLRDSDDIPDVVIFVDADCIVGNDCLNKLANACEKLNRPVQAMYLMNAKAPGPTQKIAIFAWILKNRIRPSGLYRLGLPCQLMGTGMAFPFEVFEKVSLANSNLVEDLMLGIDLAKNGYSPVYCPEARVDSSFPGEDDSKKSQRTRWEHGHLGIIASEGISLLMFAIKKRIPSLVWMTLDLMVPPLALLTIILLVVFFAVTSITLLANLDIFPILAALTVCFVFFMTISMSWFRYARDVLSVTDLVKIPSYILSKIPIYIRFLIKRQVEWVRTNRN